MQAIGSLKFLKSLSLVAVLAVSPVLAHADSIPFNLVDANSAAGSLTGTVGIDSATGLVTSALVSLAGGPVFDTVSSESAANGIGRAFLSTSGSSPQTGMGEFALYYELISFGTGSGPLNLCVRDRQCGDRGAAASFVHLLGSDGTQGPVYLTSGELDPSLTPFSPDKPASTPEPSSLVLLGTGICGFAALLARFSRRDNTEPSAPHAEQA